MSDGPRSRLETLGRRRLLGLLGAAGAVGLTWDVVRGAANVDVSGPESRPETTDEAVAEYATGATQFGLDLLDTLVDEDPDRNVMVSPLGLSGALAMAWAGTRGETERRMAETLHYPFEGDRLHPAVGALQYDLSTRGQGVTHREFPEVWETNRFELGLSNALWGQSGSPFADPFLDTLSENYGSDLRAVDFDGAPDAARRRINRWGRTASNGRVEELVPPNAIDRTILFVLTNAVFLAADWQQPFDPEDTDPGAFRRADGTRVQVPMMTQEGEFSLLWERGEEAPGGVGYKAVELPYVGGDVSMVLAVPWGEGDPTLTDLEAVVDAEWLESRFAELDERESHDVRVTMPRFTFGNDLELSEQLEAMGMTTAFDAGRADFGDLTDPPEAAADLRLAWVYHDTHVSVDEEGTVAVAVSAIGGQMVSAPPSIRLNRPFLFCIRDRETDGVLFLGRVVDPSGE